MHYRSPSHIARRIAKITTLLTQGHDTALSVRLKGEVDPADNLRISSRDMTSINMNATFEALLVEQDLTYDADAGQGKSGNNITIEYIDFIAAVAALATLDITADIILTSAVAGAARNTDDLTLQIIPAAANPTDTILAVWTGDANNIVLTITPNDGTNNGATPVDLTTAELVEYINTGDVAAKSGQVSETDVSGLRNDQTAAGGDATVLVDSGEGDGVVATFSAGANAIGDAGNEVVTVNDNAITVRMEDGVSDADEIKAAIDAFGAAAALVDVTVSGTGTTAQNVITPTNLAGGEDRVVFNSPDDSPGSETFTIDKDNILIINRLRTKKYLLDLSSVTRVTIT